MSGVNAHALFSPAPEKDQGTRPALLGSASYLQRKLVWPVPHPHHLLQLCTASSAQQAAFTFNIVATTLAYLADHKVRPIATTSWNWKPSGAPCSHFYLFQLVQLVTPFKSSHKHVQKPSQLGQGEPLHTTKLHDHFVWFHIRSLLVDVSRNGQGRLSLSCILHCWEPQRPACTCAICKCTAM